MGGDGETARGGESSEAFRGFLSVGGRDLVLDLTDLLFQAEAPLLCGILIPDYITFHLAIRQTTATPPLCSGVLLWTCETNCTHECTNMEACLSYGFIFRNILHIIISIIIIGAVVG